MDKVTRYRQLIQQVLEATARELSQGNQAVLLPACDPRNDQYLLVTLGWINRRREHDICFHARLLGDQVHIEIDLTEEGLTDELIAAGIAEADIHHAWISPARAREVMAVAA